jgi:hypothetical protein
MTCVNRNAVGFGTLFPDASTTKPPIFTHLDDLPRLVWMEESLKNPTINQYSKYQTNLPT